MAAREDNAKGKGLHDSTVAGASGSNPCLRAQVGWVVLFVEGHYLGRVCRLRRKLVERLSRSLATDLFLVDHGFETKKSCRNGLVVRAFNCGMKPLDPLAVRAGVGVDE